MNIQIFLDGFVYRWQSGAQARYVHPDGCGVTVPIYPGDVPVPVLRSILRQTGLSMENWETL